jgi:hypothetical protein
MRLARELPTCVRVELVETHLQYDVYRIALSALRDTSNAFGQAQRERDVN